MTKFPPTSNLTRLILCPVFFSSIRYSIFVTMSWYSSIIALFLTLKRFGRFFCCFHCWLLTSKYQLGACNLYQSFVPMFYFHRKLIWRLMYPMLPLVLRIFSVFFWFKLACVSCETELLVFRAQKDCCFVKLGKRGLSKWRCLIMGAGARWYYWR